MQEVTNIWLTLVGGAFLSGVCMVAVLVTRRSAERLFKALGITSFLISIWSFALISEAYARLDAVLYAVVFALAGAAGGYALASTLLGMLARTTRAVADLAVLPADTGTAALVILGDDEPSQYDERATATSLERLSEEGLLHASIGVLPFLFMAQKARYRAVGGSSGSAKQLDALAEQVESSLGPNAFGAVGAASLRGPRDLESAVRNAASRGYRRIVVAAALIGESLELDQEKRNVDALRLADKGVQVAYTEVLANSERVAALVASRIMAVSGDPTTTGAVLVGEAQPETRSKSCRHFDEQESAFLNRVRMHLMERGLADSHIRIAWSDWRTPDVTVAARHLAALGCLRIVVSPTCFPLDTIASTLDVQIALRQARLDPSVTATTLVGYANDPTFAEEIRMRAHQALTAIR